MNIRQITSPLEAETLLNGASLVTIDLENNDKVRLFGIYQNDRLIACIGVEIYSNTALLRSLAVDSNFRKNGIGKHLSDYVENICKQNNVKEIFLLTENAEQYFKKLGYQPQKRENAPLSIMHTTQFSELCPSSSKLMRKNING